MLREHFDFTESAPLLSADALPSLGVGDDGLPIMIDVERLLLTKLLIQAMSGGGKSYALRRLLEQLHGKVQQIVFDPEGELKTLSEGFDYLVCAGDSQECPISPATGAEVASAIFRSGRSAILSLEEFEIDDMQRFFADFVGQLMRMPQDSWHRVLIAVDEAQLFAPQHEKGGAAKKALVDLSGRGRKRGLGMICATLRLSQLHKGVAAHLSNKLIGLTTLPLDIEGSAEQLGMRTRDAQAVLPYLNTGDFLAYGPALSHTLRKVRIGAVTTRHGALGSFDNTAPVPSMTREALAEQIRQIAVRPGPVAQRIEWTLDGWPLQTNARFHAIFPLIGAKPEADRLARRALELDITASSLTRWLSAFDPDRGPSSLHSARSPLKLIARLKHLDPSTNPDPDPNRQPIIPTRAVRPKPDMQEKIRAPNVEPGAAVATWNQAMYTSPSYSGTFLAKRRGFALTKFYWDCLRWFEDSSCTKSVGFGDQESDKWCDDPSPTERTVDGSPIGQ